MKQKIKCFFGKHTLEKDGSSKIPYPRNWCLNPKDRNVISMDTGNVLTNMDYDTCYRHLNYINAINYKIDRTLSCKFCKYESVGSP